MMFLKSSIIMTLFLISNINPFKFPDYLNKSKTQSETRTTTESSTETTATTNSPIEITTSTDSSSETTTASDNLTENETESNNEPFCGDLAVGNYCVDPAGYPEENILKAVVSQQGILSSFFEEVKPDEITPLFPGTPYEEYYDYTQDEEFENVCRTETDHIMPRAAKNTKGEFQFIVNRPKGDDSFIQKVQVSKCVNPGNECGDGAGGVLNAKTECHQEFLEHKLVAVTKDGAQVVVDTFKFPSCCTCRISRNK